ncbi:hypothetical protein GPALN_004590 [Globodera pallida]|nr:hypothetical protein GPALN_004590 [Globodera pallida]
MAEEIESDLDNHRTDINIEHPAIYDLVIAHFYRFSGSYSQVDFKVEDYCNLTNFMLQLMNRVKESPNLSEYFVHAKFSTELEQQLDLVKEGQETEKDRELMKIINRINRLELNKLMPKLQTLENFEEIRQAYENLKVYERKCTESEVTLNDELEKAKTFCMEKI